MTLTAGQLRLDLKCGSGHIAQGKKCHRGVGAPSSIAQVPIPPSPKKGSSRGRKLAIGAALAGTAALGAGLTIASSRKQIFNAPGAIKRAAQKGVTEAVHRATAKPPSMKLTGRAVREMSRGVKKRSMRRKMMLTMEAARRKQEPGYRKPRFADKRKDAFVRLDKKSAAWQRKEGKNPEGGLNAKGIASYRRQNPGSKLSLAVTTDPSKLKPGSAKAERRRRFCSRMSGMKRKLTSAKTANDPDSRINKSLRKWNC